MRERGKREPGGARDVMRNARFECILHFGARRRFAPNIEQLPTPPLYRLSSVSHAATSSVRHPDSTVSLTCARAHRSHATMSSRDGSRMRSFLCASIAFSITV